MSINNVPLAPVPPENMRFVKASDFRAVYANWVQGTFTPYDISLVVGEAYPSVELEEEKRVVEVNQRLRVVFSPLEAKMAMAILHQAIRGYEEQFGTIDIPGPIGEEHKNIMRGANSKNLDEGFTERD